jgi:hypothetical protein
VPSATSGLSLTLGLGITFALACASATFFLFLRCHGAGRPLGRSSWTWALLVIGVTSVVSTAVAFVGTALVDRLPLAFLGVGVAGPSGLWLSEIRNRRDEPRGLLRDVSTLWLTRLLARLQEAMAEDRATWCERRLDEAWSAAELGMAARFYQEYLRERMTPDERRRGRLNAQLNAIEARLTVVQLVENSAGRTKVAAALQGSRTTKDARYSSQLGDLARMADIMRHDAERELVRLLGSAYNAGYYRMPVFTPPPMRLQTLPPSRPPRREARPARRPAAT